ncbi:hypothetical protein SAMN06265348_111169 [Pedobacter westerhofensis]|uniref:Uncharacterized protein n=1 Tax=Pedobacter westerhofensis TaxID=425512 RepID=A0A521FDJ9_9SPHI|nr:hypothetical protein [Pedobacter westerhofensis]SMO94266.1 hypothetical protein SAMN06265348_111169 [Pedobacter westerhofensis]
MVILIAKATAFKKKFKDKYLYDQMLLKNNLEIARLILERQLPAEQEEILMNFLFNYINFEFTETKVIFDREINLLSDKNINTMTIQEILVGQAKLQGKRLGLKEGIKEGRKEAKEEEVSRLITKLRFTDEQIVDFAGVSLTTVKKVRRSVARSIH